MGEASRAPVYHFEVELTATESPVVGSGHAVDLALLLRADGPELTAEERASGCRAFFGRDALGAELEKVAEDLRDSVVRFATEGCVRFNAVPVPHTLPTHPPHHTHTHNHTHSLDPCLSDQYHLVLPMVFVCNVLC